MPVLMETECSPVDNHKSQGNSIRPYVGNAGFEREGKADHPGLLEAALCGTFDDADFGFRNDFLELDLG
jgi:hypothetical protein